MAAVLSLIFCAIVAHSQSSFRLPTTVLPINYQLQLHPDIPNSNFNGIESIQINITDSYFVDADLSANFDVSFNYYPNNNMQISVAELRVSGSTTETYALSDLSLDATTQIATPSFDVTKEVISTLVTNDANTFTLYMEYSANIRGGTDLAGLYKSTYSFNNITVENLVTQFQATDARSAFPCFDEPAFKATFDITLIGPVDAVKLSNMPSTTFVVVHITSCTFRIIANIFDYSTQTTEEYECIWTAPTGISKTECEMVTFATTPIMSTYLVAFVIGGYLNVTEGDDSFSQTVYYPLTFDANRAQFALDESLLVLDLFGGADGFNIPYTESGIPKLDTIGVSDFAAGAMENWGLMVYRTVRLLVDPEVSSQAAKNGQITVIAHEIAHQWFGNLVSPAWWDDLWLNEGFATFMAYYGANRIEPEYNLIEEKIQAITNVMIDDSSVFTSAVKQNIDGDPTQILSSFSSITYQKGMGVINTMANIMGNAQFLSGITTYLDQYKFSTATSEQLGAVLDTTSVGISDLMDSFINQEGFPLISIESQTIGDNEESITFTITQQRFVKQGRAFYAESGVDNIPFIDASMVSAFENQLWTVPMLWRDAEGQIIVIDGTTNNLMTVRQLNSTKARITDGPEFYLVNPIDGGSEIEEGLFSFFRVYYDDFSLQLLVDNWSLLGKQDQFAIISDRYALMLASYISPESYLDFLQDVVDKMIDAMDDISDYYPIFNTVTKSLLSIDDIFCELVFDGNGNDQRESADDRALIGYFRDFATSLLRRILDLVVDDLNEPFADDHDACPDNSDCNILQSVLLNALVRLNDRNIIESAYEIFYLCENRVCDDQINCRGCNEARVENGRISFVSEDVLQALIAGVLAYDTSNDNALNEIIELYSLVNIEQQTYILNAFYALYLSFDENQNSDLIDSALEFIMSETVRDNMRINALVSLKVCTAREPLWNFLTSPNGNDSETVFDSLFGGGSGLFSQEPLTALGDSFASTTKYEEVSAFFNDASYDRVNAGTLRTLNQSLENIYTRYLWKEANQDGMQTYMRTYIVNKYESSLEIWEIVLVTVGCCAGLVCMVLAFWGISRPTNSDRMIQYMSLKRMKRERRKSSMSQQGPLSGLNQSLDRSLKGNTNQYHQTIESSRSDHEQSGNEAGNDIVEEAPTYNGGGYGSTA